MVWDILPLTSVCWISPEETIGYAAGDDAVTSCLDFLGILFMFFCAAVIILIGMVIYRSWKIRRLTNPLKERTYKH